MASNTIFKIHHVQETVMAFSIDFEMFFLQTQPIPQIFNSSLSLQLVPNIDSWFQAKTQQRYSYRGVLDMMWAYSEGLKHTYSTHELENFIRAAVLTAREQIFFNKMSEYSKFFWIEVLDLIKFENSQLQIIRDKFDYLKNKLGVDEFFNNLCRIWSVSVNNLPSLARTIEILINRLGKVPQSPIYPNPVDLDNELQNAVILSILGNNISTYRNIDHSVQQKVNALLFSTREKHDVLK